MDPSIRPVEPSPVPLTRPVRRRGEDGEPFDLERELSKRGRRAHDEPEGSEDEPAPAADPAHVAPRPDDEAGSHLDVTA